MPNVIEYRYVMIISSEPYHNRNPYLIITAICIVFILGKTNSLYPLTTILRASLYPILEGNRYTQSIIQNEWATFTQLRTQRYQIEQLKEENTRLLADNTFMKLLRDEQRTWYAQNNIKPLPGFTQLPAVVIASHDTMVLTMKAKAEVPPRSVIVAQQHLVGLVAKQDDLTITAYTLKSLPVELPVVIVGKDGIKGRGLLMPAYGTKVEIQRVLQNIQVVKGDSVMLLPTSEWPDSIRIGTVEKITRRESDVFQSLEVVHEVAESNLLNVSVYVKNRE